MKTTIWITTQFEGFHRWKDAPDSVSYLRDYHRHIFHVKLGKVVKHDNREIEFITLKNSVDAYIAGIYKGKKFEDSCEQIATKLLSYIDGDYCEVSEDGENGARIEKLNIWGKSPLEEVFKREKEKKKLEIDSISNNSTNTYEELKRKKDKMFVGIEAEGPCRGYKTLFIPGSMNYDVVSANLFKLSKVIENGEITKVYLGAGNDYVFQPVLLNLIKNYFFDRNITIEVEKFTKELFNVTTAEMIIVSLNHLDKQNYPYDNRYIKYVEYNKGIIFWVNYECRKIYTTLMSDPLFKQDEDIE